MEQVKKAYGEVNSYQEAKAYGHDYDFVLLDENKKIKAGYKNMNVPNFSKLEYSTTIKPNVIIPVGSLNKSILDRKENWALEKMTEGEKIELNKFKINELEQQPKEGTKYVVVSQSDFVDTYVSLNTSYPQSLNTLEELKEIEIPQVDYKYSLYVIESKKLEGLRREDFVSDRPDNGYNEIVFKTVNEEGKLITNDLDKYKDLSIEEKGEVINSRGEVLYDNKYNNPMSFGESEKNTTGEAKKVTEIPFSKNAEGEFVLKSIDEKEFDLLAKKEGFNHKIVYREYTDAIGEPNYILTKNGETFAKNNGINPTPIGSFDYSEKELNEKKSLLVTNNNSQQEVKTQKSSIMEDGKKEHKDQVIGFANKHNWKEDDQTEKSYLLNVNQKKIMEQKGDEYGSVKIGIKKVEHEVHQEGQTQKGSNYEAILYPRKDDKDIEAVISVKKAEIEKLQGKGDYHNVALVAANRDPLKASKDDLAVYVNPIEKGMNEAEKKKAMEHKTYVGTGWTQKPEFIKLHPSQLTSDELKKSISENNLVKAQAIVLQGGKKLVTKDMVDTVAAAKEQHKEKFKPELEKVVTDNIKQGKGKDKGLKV